MSVAYAPGVPVSAKIDSSVTNVPVAYSTAAGSKVLTGLAQFNHAQYTHIAFINGSSALISISTTQPNAAAPSSVTTQKFFCPANGAAVYDLTYMIDTVWLQSESGSLISSGIITVTVW